MKPKAGGEGGEGGEGQLGIDPNSEGPCAALEVQHEEEIEQQSADMTEVALARLEQIKGMFQNDQLLISAGLAGCIQGSSPDEASPRKIS